MSINGRLFLAPSEHLDALTPLPEQEGPSKGTWQILEMFGSKELAYIITLYDWELFNAVHPVNYFKFKKHLTETLIYFFFKVRIDIPSKLKYYMFLVIILYIINLTFKVFGRHKFNKITSNLDLFMRRFNEVQFWVCTELCLCPNIGKRVTLLRKFIKLASQ